MVRRVPWLEVRLEREEQDDKTGAAASCCGSATMGAWAESVQVGEAVQFWWVLSALGKSDRVSE